MKQCSNCNVAQPDDKFYQRSGRPGVLHSWCISCMKELRVKRNPEIAEYQRKRRANYTEEDKQMGKDYQLRYKFDLTLSEYENLVESQQHSCAICRRPDGSDAAGLDSARRLSVDHDHTTRMVRGLLCTNCNNGLGRFMDSARLLRAAADYLDKHGVKEKLATLTAEDVMKELARLD